ncbi:hypothetical protein JCM16358_01720 [Halanaerocella petrolearia]
MGKEYTTTISCQTYLKALSDEPIDPDDISVEIEAGTSTPELDSTVLAILWTNFQACRQGLLEESQPGPWSEIKEEGAWTQFLRQVITDTSWVDWIEDPDEVRKRTKEGYKQIRDK